MTVPGGTAIGPARAAMARTLSPHRAGPTVLATVEVDLAPLTALARGDGNMLHAAVVKAAANALVHHRLFTWAYNGAYRVFPTDRIDIRAPAGPGTDAAFVVVRSAEQKTLAAVADEIAAAARIPVPATDADPVERLIAGHPILGRARRALDAAHAARMLFSRTYEQTFWERYRERMGTFFIANVGPLGISDFAVPVRLPSIVEVGVCAPFQKTVLRGGVLGERPALHIVGRLDHRMTDVGQTARFLSDMKKNLENPAEGLGPAKQ